MININETLVLQLINFLLLMLLLNRFLFRPLVRLLDTRAARTEGRQAEATRAEAEAEAMLADYETKLRAARLVADEARTEVLRQADQKRQELLSEAAAESDKAQAEIRARVRAETEQARRVLIAESQTLATAAATRILGRTL